MEDSKAYKRLWDKSLCILTHYVIHKEALVAKENSSNHNCNFGEGNKKRDSYISIFLQFPCVKDI